MKERGDAKDSKEIFLIYKKKYKNLSVWRTNGEQWADVIESNEIMNPRALPLG